MSKKSKLFTQTLSPIQKNKFFKSKKSKRSKRSKRSWIKNFLWGLLLAGILYWGFSEWKFREDLNEKISIQTYFQVEKGESVSSFAARLEQDKIIVSASSLEKFLKRNEMGKKIKFGNHLLSGDLSIPEIAQMLTEKTVPKTQKITIPEGLTIKEIDALLVKKFPEKFSAGDFLECVTKSCDFSEYSFLPTEKNKWEGYFFPATYSLPLEKISAENLAKKMLNAFEGRMKKYNLDEYKNYSLQDVLIMASIIEKESSGKSFNTNEAKMISGILWNRIEQGIPLGADATIRYGLSKDSSALTVSELRAKNDFNTRTNKGFPPYAISAPGGISMDAAVNPAKTDYLFYLHDKSQKIHYAKTNAWHEANKRKFCGGSCE